MRPRVYSNLEITAQRDAARRVCGYLAGACVFLFALSLYEVTRPVIVEPCTSRAPVMQLDPTEIRAKRSDGVWL